MNILQKIERHKVAATGNVKTILKPVHFPKSDEAFWPVYFQYFPKPAPH